MLKHQKAACDENERSLTLLQEAVREELADAVRRVSELETRLEEAHSKEAHLKSTNKVCCHLSF